MKTELVVAVRPSGESLTLARDWVGLEQLVGRLGKMQRRKSSVCSERLCQKNFENNGHICPHWGFVPNMATNHNANK